MPNSRYPWRVLWVLLAAAVCGVLALMPYVLVLFERVARDASGVQVSGAGFVTMQVLHLTLIFGMAVSFGLLLARRVGLRLPLLSRLEGESVEQPRGALRAAVIAGVAVGAYTVLALYGFVLPRIPQWPSEATMPLWTRFLICIYGAVNEELLMRLFLLSLLLWIMQKIVRSEGRPHGASFWIANTLGAVIYGAAYLPAAAAVVQVTTFVALSIVGVKAVAGLVFGQLFRKYGLETAMLAHFVSDILIHVIGPVFAAS